MSNARNLANLLGTGTQITTADIADGAFQANKNLIINGAMQVAQRGTSSTSGTGYNTVDRVNIVIGNTDELSLTQAQVSDAPDGFANSYKLTTSTAETALAADERVAVDFVLEAQNLQQLKYGTASAESVTLSFWVKSSVTGNYAFWLYQDDATRGYATTYTVNSANTWEQKIITVPGDTSGVINDDNGRGMTLRFHVAAGSSYVGGTQNSWLAYASNTEAAGQVADIATTLNATWQVTGVQLELGSTATPFEHRSYGDELARCQRYLFSGDAQCLGSADSAGNIQLCVQTPVNLRANPTLVSFSAALRGALIATATGAAFSAMAAPRVTISVTNTGTVNTLLAGFGGSCSVQLDAEL
jgi:hypothetical protein